MNTAFTVGQAVKSKVDAQGLVKGATYTVTEINTQSFGMFGTLVYYTVQDAEGDKLVITNGHLLLEAAPAPAPANPTKNQVFPKATVSIMVGKATGVRYAHITPTGSRQSFDVPVSMLSLAAGKDAWMRDVLVKCSDCRQPVKAGDMECELCPACYDKAGEENARLDGAVA